VDKEELIKFQKSSVSGFGSRNCLKNFSTLLDRPFFLNLDNIYGKTDGIFMKLFSQESPH